MLPLTIVVFGATGDLFKKKLITVFFDIYQKKEIPDDFTLIGLSRKSLSHSQFRELAHDCIEHVDNEADVESFLSKLFYYSIDATDENSLLDLRDILDNVDQSFGRCSNKLFYIATVPQTYEDIFNNISKTGLSVPCVGSHKDTKAWIRLVVEKPFGTDELNAKRLDELLGKSFEEKQIFRIDHYLAKEAVQNIYSFRFDNIMFSPIWNSEFIEKIEIVSFEHQDVENRKEFYNAVGAFKDVGQNHLLELLTLVTMEKPKEYLSDMIREERARLLSFVTLNENHNNVFCTGQYNGYATHAYAESKTETYFRIPLQINNRRWKDTLIILEHGKAMSETFCQIRVSFKNNDKSITNNKILINIQPSAGICAFLNTGEKDMNVEKKMCFELGVSDNQYIYPYEKLLIDALRGDQTLFVSTDEVKEEWKITERVLEILSKVDPVIYEKGSKNIS